MGIFDGTSCSTIANLEGIFVLIGLVMWTESEEELETVDRDDIGDSCVAESAWDGVQWVDNGRMLDSAGNNGDDSESASVGLFGSPTATVTLLLLHV